METETNSCRDMVTVEADCKRSLMYPILWRRVSTVRFSDVFCGDCDVVILTITMVFDLEWLVKCQSDVLKQTVTIVWVI